MGIAILVIVFILFEKRIRENGQKVFLVINTIFVAYIVFSIIMNDYLQNVYGWEYGVPGADLTAHFDGAKALAEGTKIRDLYLVNQRFALQLSNFGYILYALLLRLISFTPVVFSYRFTVHLMYTLQIMIAILGADNLCRIFQKASKKYNYSLMFATLSCVCIAQQASSLMRDIWVFYFLTLLFSTPFNSRRNILGAIILVCVSALLRFYTVLISVPFFIWKVTDHVELGVISSFVIIFAFSIGQPLIQAFAVWFGIKWEFGFNYDALSIIKYILFPNIISQTHNVQHMVTSYHAIHGGNTEWIYYMLSCWNVYVYPIAGYGMVKCLKNKANRPEGILWLCQIINIGLLYSVFYNSVSEPRHKLLIIFGLLFFYDEGAKRMSTQRKLMYSFVVIFFLLGTLAFIN